MYHGCRFATCQLHVVLHFIQRTTVIGTAFHYSQCLGLQLQPGKLQKRVSCGMQASPATTERIIGTAGCFTSAIAVRLR